MADTDATLRIVISSAEAVQNARRVRDELRGLGDDARRAQERVDNAARVTNTSLRTTTSGAQAARDALNQVNQRVRETETATKALNVSLDGLNTKSVRAAGQMETLGTKTAETRDKTRDTRVQVDGLVASLGGLEGRSVRAAGRLRDAGAASEEAGASLDRTRTRSDAIAVSFDRLGKNTVRLAGQMDAFRRRSDETTGALNRLASRGANETSGALSRLAQTGASVRGGFERLASQTVSLNGAFLRLAAAAGTLAAPAVGAGGLGAVAVLASQAASNLQDAADRAGVATSRFQELRFALRQVGVEQEQVTTGLQELRQAAAEFAAGNAGGTVTDAFGALGLSRDRVQGLQGDTEALFETVIGRIQGINSQSQQLNLLDALFGGTAGEQFLQVTEEGVGRLRELEQAAGALGATLTEDAAQAADQANRLFLALWQTLKNRVIVAVADNANEIRRLAEDALAALPGVIDGVVDATKALARNFDDVLSVAGGLSGFFIGSMIPGFGAIGGAIASGDKIAFHVEKTEAT